MTMPGLAQEIIESQESPMIMRIGVVTAIEAADSITVKISGSNVLVRASYLFPAYEPLLGDRVYVTRQDAQWFVHGTPSGTINSLIPNPSFELGEVGLIPDDWAIEIISTAGGTPFFVQRPAGAQTPRGKFGADLGVVSTAAGFSEANVYSSQVAATPGSHWTAAYFISTAFIPASAVQFSTLELFIQFLNDAGTPFAESLVDFFDASVDMYTLLYRRLRLSLFPSGYVVAPGGTAAVRIKFRVLFDMPVNNFASFLIDDVILRQVD